MPSLRIKQQFEITGLTSLPLPLPAFGDPSQFEEAAVAGSFFHIQGITVADNFSIVELWNTVGGGPTSFLWGAIRTTADILLELSRASAPEEYAFFEVHSGPWNIFGGRVGSGEVAATNSGFQAAGVEETIGTHYGLVQRLVAKRNVADGLGDAVVELLLVL